MAPNPFNRDERCDMVTGPIFNSLAEAWDEHITAVMGGTPMQIEEYRDRQLDYLSGAYDLICVFGTLILQRTDNGKLPITSALMKETFYSLFEDTQTQHDNLVQLLGRDLNNAQSDPAMDDKPQ